jgi:hypothetical protein
MMSMKKNVRNEPRVVMNRLALESELSTSVAKSSSLHAFPRFDFLVFEQNRRTAVGNVIDFGGEGQ